MLRVGVWLLALVLVAGCSAEDAAAPAPTSPTSPSSSSSSAAPSAPSAVPSQRPSPSASPAPGSVPPPWLGTRVLPRTPDGFGEVRATPRVLRRRSFTLPDRLPMLPGRGFAAHLTSPAPNEVLARSTWAPGCPVRRDQLAWLQVTFRGFDDRRHTGEVLINASVADDVIRIFAALWRARFPMEQLAVTTVAERDAAPTGDGNGTGGFVCRAVTGGTSYSQHAYGLAIDVDPFQNPYAKGDLVVPELASSYLDRSDVRPGLITPDGPVVRAFAAVGWQWGGAWTTLKDYQHFSPSGL